MNVKHILVGLLLILMSTEAITECNGGRSRKAQQQQQCTGESCSLKGGKKGKGYRGRHMRRHGKRHGGWGMRGRGTQGQGMKVQAVKAQGTKAKATESTESEEEESSTGNEEAVESKD